MITVKYCYSIHMMLRKAVSVCIKNDSVLPKLFLHKMNNHHMNNLYIISPNIIVYSLAVIHLI